MSGSVFELLDLIARWVHVIAGIMWIGNSMLFNWLDRSLVVDSDPSRPNAPLGTIWLAPDSAAVEERAAALSG